MRSRFAGLVAVIALLNVACTGGADTTTSIEPPAPTIAPTTTSTPSTTTTSGTATTAAISNEETLLSLGIETLCPFGATEPLAVETSAAEGSLYGIVTCDLLAYQVSFNVTMITSSGEPTVIELPVPPGWATTPTIAGPHAGLATFEGDHLEILSKARGIGDCGWLGRWRLTDSGPVLAEFRDQPCLDQGGPLPDDWLVIYTEADGALDGPIPDGSGCTPGDPDTIPDGVWYGYATILPDAVEIDLVCLYTGDEAAKLDPSYIDYVVVNQSRIIRTLPYGENAAVVVWDFETFGPLDLTVLEAIDYADDCDLRPCAPDGGVRLMIVEITVEFGVVLEIRELPSA